VDLQVGDNEQNGALASSVDEDAGSIRRIRRQNKARDIARVYSEYPSRTPPELSGSKLKPPHLANHPMYHKSELIQ
jgi:hypothetical protein